ncbi:MAG: type II toxin-antitoxin system CcdA family antitoxin [Cyanobacteria bacterium J06638_6]
MHNPTSSTDERSAGKIDLSVQIDKDLLDQVTHLSSNPSKVIEVALRQWLRGDRRYEDDLVRHLPRNPTVPPKGEWND